MMGNKFRYSKLETLKLKIPAGLARGGTHYSEYQPFSSLSTGREGENARKF